MTTPAPANAHCPRCGRAFHCGVATSEPCACAGIVLGATLQAQLRAQFQGCLCMECLRALAAAQARPSPAPASGAR